MKINITPHLIAFILRCSASATIGYMAAQSIGLPYPIWTAISAIVVSQEQFSETRISITRRFIGTIIGILIGIAIHCATTPLIDSLALQIALSVALSALLAYGRPSFRAALWTGPIVLLTVTPTDSIFLIGFYRGCEVILGGILGGGLHFLSDRILHIFDKSEKTDKKTSSAIEE